MGIALSPEELRNAPRVWVRNGVGVGVRVIDPKWRAAMEGRQISAKKIAEENYVIRHVMNQTERNQHNAEARAVAAMAEQIRAARRDKAIKEWYQSAHAAGGDPRPAFGILKQFADFYGYSVDDVLGPRRTHKLVTARHHATYEAARLCPLMSLPALGRVFNRDHTSILHCLREWPAKAAALGIECPPLNREPKA